MNPRIKFLMSMLHDQFSKADVAKFLLNAHEQDVPEELTDAHMTSLEYRFRRGIDLLLDGKSWSPVNPSLRYSFVKQDDGKTRWLFHGPLDSALIANAYYLFCEYKKEFKQCARCRTFFYPVDDFQKYHTRECYTNDLDDQIREVEHKKRLIECGHLDGLIRRKNYLLVWSLLPEDEQISEYDGPGLQPQCRAAARHRSSGRYPQCKQPVMPGEVLCPWHGGRKERQARRRMNRRATVLQRLAYRRGVREHRAWREEGLRLAHELQQRMIDRLQERA